MSKPRRRAIPGVQYLVDSRGDKTAVVIDLAQNSELWEDFYDCAVAASRADEPIESFESVEARLRARKRRGEFR